VEEQASGGAGKQKEGKRTSRGLDT